MVGSGIDLSTSLVFGQRCLTTSPTEALVVCTLFGHVKSYTLLGKMPMHSAGSYSINMIMTFIIVYD